MKQKLFTRHAVASVLLLGMTATIAACSSNLKKVGFVCEDQRYGSVTWRPDQTALLIFHGSSWVLHPQPSETGVRYGDGVHEIWEDQGTIEIKTGNTPDAMCRAADD